MAIEPGLEHETSRRETRRRRAVLTGLRSRKHIAPFDLVRPTSIDACLSWLSRGPRIGLMAGGLDLIDRMKFGQPFDTIVSLSAIPDLDGIRQTDGAIIVGALTTHAALSAGSAHRRNDPRSRDALARDRQSARSSHRDGRRQHHVPAAALRRDAGTDGARRNRHHRRPGDRRADRRLERTAR